MWRLVEVPDGASLGETHDEAAVLADHQSDLVSSEAPLAGHLAPLLLGLQTRKLMKRATLRIYEQARS